MCTKLPKKPFRNSLYLKLRDLVCEIRSCVSEVIHKTFTPNNEKHRAYIHFLKINTPTYPIFCAHTSRTSPAEQIINSVTSYVSKGYLKMGDGQCKRGYCTMTIDSEISFLSKSHHPNTVWVTAVARCDCQDSYFLYFSVCSLRYFIETKSKSTSCKRRYLWYVGYICVFRRWAFLLK